MNIISATQNIHIQHGAQKRKRMILSVERLMKNPEHMYVFSDPGLGKTYNIEQVLEDTGAQWVPIKGNTSLWGFIVDLAQIVSLKDPGQEMFVFIDDCDNLLQQTDSINTMKIALNDGVLNYNKSLGAQYSQLDEMQQECIDRYRQDGRTGISIPLNGLTFIWASNYKLADQGDYTDKTSDTKRQKMIHEEALRRRMRVHDAVMDDMIKWGWIADCVLNSTPPSMTNADVDTLEYILDWMYSNWTRLKEHNISFAEKLYGEIQLDLDGYKTAWELDYLI